MDFYVTEVILSFVWVILICYANIFFLVLISHVTSSVLFLSIIHTSSMNPSSVWCDALPETFLHLHEKYITEERESMPKLW